MGTYIIAGLLWGIFATIVQTKIHPEAPSSKTILCGFMNMIGWPIGLVIASYMLISGKHDKYLTPTLKH